MKAYQQPAAGRDRNLNEVAPLHPRAGLLVSQFFTNHFLTNHRAPPFATISAARWMALRIRGYVPQRQTLPVIASSMSPWVGLGLSRNSSAPLMSCPDWQ